MRPCRVAWRSNTSNTKASFSVGTADACSKQATRACFQASIEDRESQPIPTRTSSGETNLSCCSAASMADVTRRSSLVRYSWSITNSEGRRWRGQRRRGGMSSCKHLANSSQLNGDLTARRKEEATVYSRLERRSRHSGVHVADLD